MMCEGKRMKGSGERTRFVEGEKERERKNKYTDRFLFAVRFVKRDVFHQ